MRTNAGEISEHQLKMYKEKIRSIGISLLGGMSGSAGKYELGIDSIRIVNDEDVVTAHSKLAFEQIYIQMVDTFPYKPKVQIVLALSFNMYP